MGSLYKKIQKVETLQRNIDHEIKIFKLGAGISCIQHCSECCKFPEIQATPLEFLPFAWHAFRLGQLDHWFNTLEKGNSAQQCIFYRDSSNSWGCQIYPVRGLICRLFGFSATINKNGQPQYGACRILKQQQPEKLDRIRQQIPQGLKIPVMAHQYRLLANIDPVTGNDFMPINKAIMKALEIIYFHFEYRECA